MSVVNSQQIGSNNEVLLAKALFGNLSKLAPERFAQYQTSHDRDDLDPLARYLFNTALCEALYPTLNAAEILLKNTLHNALTGRYGEAWFDTPGMLEPGQQKDLQTARSKLALKGKAESTNQIVAELSFGFWTSLLSEPYWLSTMQTLNAVVFPNYPVGPRKRSAMSRPWGEARDLRNRAFHHEPIWRVSGLSDKHSRIVEGMKWIDKAYSKLAMCGDRFPDVIEQGLEPHRRRVEQMIAACIGIQPVV